MIAFVSTTTFIAGLFAGAALAVISPKVYAWVKSKLGKTP